MTGPAMVVAVSGSVGKSTTGALVRAACDDDRLRVVEVHGHDDGSTGAEPDIGVATTLAGGDDDLVGAVTGLVRGLPATATAVLNADDDQLGGLADDLAVQVLRVSGDDRDGADLAAYDVRLDDRARARFGAHTPWGDAQVALPMAGRHHVTNALCALAVACVAGADLTAAVAGLLAADVPGGTVIDVDGLVVLDDTGHATTVSVLAALTALGAMQVPGRRVGVLGPMDGLGEAHETEHWRVGMRAARVLDRLVVVGPAATPITAGARDAAMPRVELVDDAAGALDALVDLAPGDAVLVKGGRTSGLGDVVAGLRGPRGTGRSVS